MRRLFALLLVGGACRSAPAVSPARTDAMPTTTKRPAIDEAILEQQAATQGFQLGRPGNIKVSPDGQTVLFTRTPPRSRVADLYAFDLASGQTRRLFSAADAGAETLSDEEKARRERARKSNRGVVGFDLSQDGKLALVALGGRLFTIELPGGQIRALPAGAGAAPIDARLSPDGRSVSLVRDGDLYLLDLAGGAERRLTTRPSRDVEHAVAEFVAQEEMHRFRGYWWSPDGKQIAYQRNDASRMDTLHVMDPARPEAAPVAFRYPRAGTSNAEVTLGVMPAAGGKTVWASWDRDRFPYLTQVAWERNAPLTIVVEDRRQTELVVLAVDPASGKTSELLREHDEAWINLDRFMPIWLPDGSGFLWSTERTGGWQVELRRRDGSLERVVVPRELGYEEPVGLDEEQGEFWFQGSPDARQTHIYRVAVAGGAPQQVTTADGVYTAQVGRKGGVSVVVGQLADGTSSYEVRRRDGAVAGALESVAETPPYQANVEWTSVEVEGRAFPVAIVRPRDFQPGRKYPVIDDVYGGPTSLVVQLNRSKYLPDQVYADAGFIVVRIDGRGTPGRGRDWQRAVNRDLITLCLTDQADALKALAARFPELDLGRVGVAGWSFGGYVAVMAVLLRPEVFHAAISGAPVTDWRLYDTHYTERYMGLPDENQAGYEATSAVAQAARLTRPLLLIHGTTDDNVYFANTMRLVDALFRARKHFELLPLAGITHMVPDPVVKKALAATEVEFFQRSLGSAP